MDHDAIRKAYSNAWSIYDAKGVFDENGEKIEIDQSLVDAARIELDKLNYKWERERAYPNWNTQLDYIYHNGIEKWKTDIVDPVKNKYPKPS